MQHHRFGPPVPHPHPLRYHPAAPGAALALALLLLLSGPVSQAARPTAASQQGEAMRVAVKLRAPLNEAGLPDLQTRFGLTLVHYNREIQVASFRVPAGNSPAEAALRLAADPAVAWAEPVQVRRVAEGPITPDDPRYPATQQWYYDLVNAPAAWGLEQGSPSTVIAVLDTGVLCSHPDLQPNLWRNPDSAAPDVNGYDYVGLDDGTPSDVEYAPRPDPCLRAGDPSVGDGRDNDGDGFADRGVWHGTMAAGIAAGAGNNGNGIAGMCWKCSIMVVRVATPEGSLNSDINAAGITYAASHGAKIINMSLGGPEITQAETDAINLAETRYGAVVVAAAGNGNVHPLYFPGRLSNVIAVGSSARTNPRGRAPFSNWGTGSGADRLVDVVAPGVDLWSTSVLSRADQDAGRGAAGEPTYAAGNGTSFSAPLVSGIAGLMLSRNPSLTPEQVRSILKSTATPLPDDPSDVPDAGAAWAGAGMVNAGAAVASVTPAGAPPPAPGASAAPQLLTPPSGAVLTDLGATLTWANPPSATQYQIQVIPANNDGPAINLIRGLATSYTIPPPVFGSGPYVMLPGMSYSWRVRTSNATSGIDENSPQWGPWSPAATFRTRNATSAGIRAVAPGAGAQGVEPTPVLQWVNTDTGVFYYEVQVSKDRSFNTDPATATAMVYWVLVHGGVTSPANSYTIPSSFPLEAATAYYWRVRPRIQGDGTPVEWSPAFSFTTR